MLLEKFRPFKSSGRKTISLDPGALGRDFVYPLGAVPDPVGIYRLFGKSSRYFLAHWLLGPRTMRRSSTSLALNPTW